ncbi:cation transporter [Leucobacter denitrificans]|uniref:Cation transporter n=1 Tax=Leucobacter denitrificans TaxID=683042 RepID=A0A7G9S687_9MICO|nr:cation transporter [Leucobacter denitrificans]QNN63362.1 cation transporter [Leucobacter denitrificans]
MVTNREGYQQADKEELPKKHARALKSAVKWQFFTIGYTICTITAVSFVLGGSQAMTTAWIEDMLSLLPQISFLIALLFTKRIPSKEHPYGNHRAMGIGHLLAGAALLAVGAILAFDAVTGLIEGFVDGKRTKLGEIELFGTTIWFGWVMIAVMVVIIVGPVFMYGPAKAKLAPILHNKLLYADADMAKADWQTNVASIIGVAGIGLGLWWLDGTAAIFISLGIIWDGYKNCSAAVQDLTDRRARTCNNKNPHPVRDEILALLESKEWVKDYGIRLRDMGQVFHAEIFVTPREDSVTLEQLSEVSAGVADIDWKIQDVVVVPTDPIPGFADR